MSTIWAQNVPKLQAFEPAFASSSGGLDVVQPMDLVIDDWNIFLSVLVRVSDEFGGSRIGNKIVILGEKFYTTKICF